jgi:prepilin peptidase CpaA
MAEIAILMFFPLLMIGAAFGDAFTYKIPNWLTGLMAVMFFPAALYAGMPMAEFGWSLAAAGIVLASCFALFCFGQFGGGDAKLLTAGALWIGWGALLPFVVAVAIIGGLLAIIMKAWWMIKLQAEFSNVKGLSEKVKPSIQLPYGIAIAGGAVATFPHSWLYQALT